MSSSRTAPAPPVLPPVGPATLGTVKTQLGLTDNRDDDRLTAIIAAVNDLIRGLPIVAEGPGGDVWPARVEQGAVMLAARLYRRKNSPAGFEVFGGESPAYVRRNDPDIAQLLDIGAYAGPQIG